MSRDVAAATEPGSVVRVVCEYSGSGQLVTAFDFDFMHSAYSALVAVLLRGADCETTLLSYNLRLFLGHDGSELSVNYGLFGKHLKRAQETAQEAWKLAQQTQKSLLAEHDHECVVLSVSTYDTQDTFAHIMQRTAWGYILQSWVKAVMYQHVHKLVQSCYNTYCQVHCHIDLRADAAADGIVVTVNKHLFKKVVKLKVSVYELLHSANIMASLPTHCLNDFPRLVSKELRNNPDFMALVPKLVDLASPAVQSNKDFALQVYNAHQNSKLQCFYEHLSECLKEDPDIVLLAFHREGYRVLRQAPLHVRDNEQLVMSCVSSNFRAIAYVSDRLVFDQQFMRLCMLEADKQHIDKRIQHSIVAQRIKAAKAIVS